MMKLNTSRKRVVYIWSLIIILLAAAAFVFVFMPINQQLTNAKEAIQFTEKKQELLKDRIKEQEDEELPVSGIKQKIPESMEEEGVIQLINEASDRTNTVVQSYQYLERETVEVNGEELEQLTMQINGSSSSLTNLNRFIEFLETNDRLVHISSFDFQNREESVNFQMEFNVYSKSFE